LYAYYRIDCSLKCSLSRGRQIASPNRTMGLRYVFNNNLTRTLQAHLTRWVPSLDRIHNVGFADRVIGWSTPLDCKQEASSQERPRRGREALSWMVGACMHACMCCHAFIDVVVPRSESRKARNVGLLFAWTPPRHRLVNSSRSTESCTEKIGHEWTPLQEWSRPWKLPLWLFKMCLARHDGWMDGIVWHQDCGSRR
jgi:hypothetical protein